MARVKNTARIMHKHAIKSNKTNKAVKTAKLLIKDANNLLHTGKLKVPFKPASSKKELVKQLKRRWRSGTVAKREIRKLSRSTHLLFPKRPFQRLVREIAQDYKDIRFTTGSMQAIQEAAEVFVTESFHKADMARIHAKRNTVHVEDIRFSRFMTPECLWVTPDRVWEKETFTVQQFAPSPAAAAAQQSSDVEVAVKKSTSKSSSLKKDGDEADKKRKKRDRDSNDGHKDKPKKKKNKSGSEKEEGSVAAAAAETPAAEEKTKAKKKSKPEEADNNTAEGEINQAGEAESSSEEEEEEEEDEISSNE